MKKNEILTLVAENVNSDGFGICRPDGFAVFVPGALAGERLRVRILKIKKSYAYGKIEKIISASEHRTEPVCESFGRCGGCSFLHCDYQYQLKIKKLAVVDALTRIGGIENPNVSDAIGMSDPYRYRSKAQFPVAPLAVNHGGPPERRNGFVIGFYAKRSHNVVSVADCAVQHGSHSQVLEAIKDYMDESGALPYDERTRAGLIRYIAIRAGLSSGELSVALVLNGTGCPGEKRLARRLKEAGATTALLNVNRTRTNAVLGERFRVLTGDGCIHETVGDIAYRISAGSFFQVNPLQTKALYDTVVRLGSFGGTETVLDAHCGVGGIALYVAKYVRKVYGVEPNGCAVADAEYNAALNGIGNARFICGTAEEEAPKLYDFHSGIDVLIFDPPRKGCGAALIKTAVEAGVPKIIYVSCNPPTLSRDSALLVEGGYDLKCATPIDMFPMTGETEVVCLFVTRKAGFYA